MITKFNRIQGKNIEGVSDTVMIQLMEHAYPGNITQVPECGIKPGEFLLDLFYVF
jgi:transcriptional regulator with PAS, ATPase and Fis domain